MQMLLNAQNGLLGTYNQGLEELATKPHNVIRRAREGCLASCMVISNAVRETDLSSSAVLEVLEIFANHIKNSCPPGKATIHKFRLAEVSFCGLSSAAVLLLRDVKNPSLRPILQAWSSILDWAKARFIQNIHAQKCLFQDPQETLMQLAMFVDSTNYYQANEGIRLAALDPRMLELAMHVYLAANAVSRYKFICMAYFDHYIENSVIRSDATLDTSYPKALDDLQSAAQGDPELLVDPILALLTKPEPEGTPEPNLLLGCSQCLGRFAAIPSHPVALTLKEKGLTPVSKALARLTDRAYASQRSSRFAEAFGLFLGLFSIFSGPQDGPAWLLQALQYRILHHVAACSSVLSKAPGERLPIISKLFSTNLPAYLVNPTIIFATEIALSEVSAEHHEQIMSSDLAPAWKTFIHRFFEQYIFYCYFEVAGTRKGCYRCGDAASSDRTAGLKRCSGCKNVEYCSSVCQTTDWKDHKKECKMLRDKKRGPLPRWAFAPFRRRLAAYDARRHLPGIRALAQQKYPGFPVQCICVNLDYGFFPPRLVVSLMNEVPQLHEMLLKQVEDPIVRELCFDDVRLHDGSSGVLSALEFEDGKARSSFQRFHWSVPYFCSSFGTHCRDMNVRTSLVTPYVDQYEREHETAWAVVDEIVYRSGLSPQIIFEGRMGEIRRKVIEVITREKARMQMHD